MATTTAARPAIAGHLDDLGHAAMDPGQDRQRVLFWILVVFIIFYTVFPFVWAVISSIKPNAELFTTPVDYWPAQINLTFYQFVLDNGDFLRALRNSVIVSVVDGAHLPGLRLARGLRLGPAQVPGPDPGPLPHPVDDDVPADRHPRLPLPDDHAPLVSSTACPR